MCRREGIIDRDLYVSFKDSDDRWGDPKRLGPEINTNSGELCAYVTRDGKHLFFSRKDDIYWVDVKVIEDLKPDHIK